MSDTSIKAWLAARHIDVKHATQGQREEIRQELLRRPEERRNSREGKFNRGVPLAIVALACASAVASFFVTGTWA